MLLDAYWCWLILIAVDWGWLMLIDADADWCSNKVQPGFLSSERASGVSPFNFKISPWRPAQFWCQFPSCFHLIQVNLIIILLLRLTLFAFKLFPSFQWGHCCGFFCGIKLKSGRHKANHFNPSRSPVHQHQHAYCQTTHFKVQKTTHNPSPSRPRDVENKTIWNFWRSQDFKTETNFAWKYILGWWCPCFNSAFVFWFVFLYFSLYFCICISGL